jgi:ankyrin repeat protein
LGIVNIPVSFNEGAIKQLVEHGTDLDAVDNYSQTALHCAQGAISAQILLEAGADLTITDGDGETAEALASKDDTKTAIYVLLRNARELAELE